MPRAGLTRERILQLAGELADAEGPAAITLTRIAERAGVRVPSLYKHVDGLDDVVAGLTARVYEDLGATLAALAPTEDPAADLRALAHAWRARARSSPGRFALTLRTHVGADPRIFAVGERLVREVGERLGRLGLDGVERVHAARAFRALVHGFVVIETSSGFGLPVDVDASFDAALDALLRGFGLRGR